MGFVEMTETEKTLLAATYPTADRIKDGFIFLYQEDGLRKLRAGVNYLQEKYPDADISILSFDSGETLSQTAVLRFRCGDLGEYRAMITTQDQQDVCTDTLYAAFLRPDYDKSIEELLTRDGLTVRSYTKFPNPVGKELGADSDASKLLEEKPRLPRYTHLFAAGGEDQSLAESLQQRLHDAGVYGSYTLYFTGNDSASDVLELESKRNGFARLTFTCFDVA